MTKVFKNSDGKWRGGGRVGDNNILIFFYATGSARNATLKNCILGYFFVRICKVS